MLKWNTLSPNIMKWQLAIPYDMFVGLGVFYLSWTLIIPATVVGLSVHTFIEILTAFWWLMFIVIVRADNHGLSKESTPYLPGKLFGDNGHYTIFRVVGYLSSLGSLVATYILPWETYPIYITLGIWCSIGFFMTGYILCGPIRIHRAVDTHKKQILEKIHSESKMNSGASIVTVTAGTGDNTIMMEYCLASLSLPIFIWYRGPDNNFIQDEIEIDPNWEEDEIVSFIACVLSPLMNTKHATLRVVSRQYN